MGRLDTAHVESVHNVHVKLGCSSSPLLLTLMRVEGQRFPSAEEWWTYSWLFRATMGKKEPRGARLIRSCAQLPLCPQLNVLSIWLWLSPSEESASVGNNLGVALITSRLEPNWIIFPTGCLLKDSSTMSTVRIVLGRHRQLRLYCGLVVTEWMFFPV